MPQFDAELWEKRAWDRYSRDQSSASAHEARMRLDRDLTSVTGIKAVVEWAATKGIGVVFTNRKCGGLYEGELKTVTINSRMNYEKQFFVLLHECGHILVGATSYHETSRWRMGYPSAGDPQVSNKFIHRCAIVEEEFEAWHRGKKLAKKLGITLDENRFDEIKTEFLKTYMKWALRDPDYA